MNERLNNLLGKREQLLKQIKELESDRDNTDVSYAHVDGYISREFDDNDLERNIGLLKKELKAVEEVIKLCQSGIEIPTDTESIQIGSTFNVSLTNGFNDTLTLTSKTAPGELLNKSFVSINSPIGKAVLGKKQGEEFSFIAPSGPMSGVVNEIIKKDLDSAKKR